MSTLIVQFDDASMFVVAVLITIIEQTCDLCILEPYSLFNIYTADAVLVSRLLPAFQCTLHEANYFGCTLGIVM